MKRTNFWMGALIAFLSAIANIIMIAIVVKMYQGEETFGITVNGVLHEVSYGTLALVVFPALIVLNFWSATHRPGNFFFRWVVDFFPSLALFLTVVVFAVLSGIAIFSVSGPSPSLSLLVLLSALFVWGLVDLFGNQRKNVNDIMARKDLMAGSSGVGGMGGVPDQTLRLKQRSGKPELSMKPRILIEDPEYVIERNGEYVPFNPDDMLARLTMRGEAFFQDPSSVPVEIADIEYRIVDRRPAPAAAPADRTPAPAEET